MEKLHDPILEIPDDAKFFSFRLVKCNFVKNEKKHKKYFFLNKPNLF